MKQIVLVLFLWASLHAMPQSLAECREAAVAHYPLVKQYGLIEQTTALTVENLAKQWLPQVTATAQATLQSDVAKLPDALTQLMRQNGYQTKGLKKDQYKIGVDVVQTVIDGHRIGAGKEVASLQGQVQAAQTDVELYELHQRVNQLYFAGLLLDEQLALVDDRIKLLASSENKLQSMLKHGTAAQSDFNSVKAERIAAQQQRTDVTTQRATVVRMLALLCGIEISQLQKPPVPDMPDTNLRPELRLFDTQLRLADAQERALDAQLKPTVSLFAQGFYGYPGYNMFHDMKHYNLSLGGLVGARVAWNIGALYTRRNDKAKLQLQRDATLNARDVFLFNNRLQLTEQEQDIVR